MKLSHALSVLVVAFGSMLSQVASAQSPVTEELPPPTEVTDDSTSSSKAVESNGTVSVLEDSKATTASQTSMDRPVEKPPAPTPPPLPEPPPFETIPDQEEGYDVLVQGPLHEAFGTPIEDPEAIIVSEAPPPALDEQPPGTQLKGNNIQWIRGYWMWDDSRDEFVWVSGMYREVPPGREWIPGVWVQQGDVYVWQRGFWGSASLASQATYLPEPPAPRNLSPTSTAPGDDQFWIPGEWVYQNEQYVWRAGYWSQQYDDWIWQPACYVQRPQGYVYVSGYWDYEPTIRGLPYASVYLPRSLYRRVNFRYVPRYPIARSTALLLHLFVRRGCPNYFYGNLYGNPYRTVGFQPWYQAYSPGFSNASIFTYYQWKYATAGISFQNSLTRYQNFMLANPSPGLNVRLQVGQSLLHSPVPGTSLSVSLDTFVRANLLGTPAPKLNASLSARSSGNASRNFRDVPSSLYSRGSSPSIKMLDNLNSGAKNSISGRVQLDSRGNFLSNGPRDSLSELSRDFPRRNFPGSNPSNSNPAQNLRNSPYQRLDPTQRLRSQPGLDQRLLPHSATTPRLKSTPLQQQLDPRPHSNGPNSTPIESLRTRVGSSSLTPNPFVPSTNNLRGLSPTIRPGNSLRIPNTLRSPSSSLRSGSISPSISNSMRSRLASPSFNPAQRISPSISPSISNPLRSNPIRSGNGRSGRGR